MEPVEERGGLGQLGFHVDRLCVEHERIDDGKVELARICRGETSVAIRGPLHRRSYTVAISEPDVVTHPDFVAVVQARGAG